MIGTSARPDGFRLRYQSENSSDISKA